VISFFDYIAYPLLNCVLLRWTRFVWI